MKKTNTNLIPDIVNPSPDYYCTWQTQLYATCDGKPAGQRRILGEKALFEKEKPYGWAYFFEEARKDLFFVMDDSWDVPLDGNPAYYGSLQLNPEKFPSHTAGRTNAEALRSLGDNLKGLGWKGLGGWICAQEAHFHRKPPEEYWKERLLDMQASGFAYWKVDWGKKGTDLAFRRMLTGLARRYAPDLVVEHAIAKDMIPFGDVFRTYDVPALMSIPMTMQKLAAFSDVPAPVDGYSGLINCEDEAYAAAAGGFTMGIMRHPYRGSFVNGKPDMSFPEVHRNLKTKLYEVIRAVRWHRIAPAFPFCGSGMQVSSNTLCDYWQFRNAGEEIESWWFHMPLVADCMDHHAFTQKAPAAITRNTALPIIEADENGYLPFCVASRNPNGAFAIATMGRTAGREYFIPKCSVTVHIADSDIIGVFGEYKNLILQTDTPLIQRVWMQDLADHSAFDVTDHVIIKENSVTIPGDIISSIGTYTQPAGDTSEPGVVVKLQYE